MKVKFLLLVLIVCVGCLSLIALSTASKNHQEPKKAPTRGRLKWHVEEAKKEGRRQVIISSGILEYLGTANTDIEQAFNDYTVVVAQPISKQTYQVSDNDLLTWYRFRIVDALTALKNPACFGCLGVTPPSDIPPLDSNEFLIAKAGGRLMLDGVEVIQTERGFPEFEDNQRYLLFISLYPNHVAAPAGGPLGVFKIAENETLTSIHDQSDPIKDGILSEFHGSLKLLKRHFNKR